LFPNPVGGHSDTVVYKWSRDNYGPLWVPQKGTTIPLDRDHVLKYGRCITAYEGHTLESNGTEYLLDGKPVKEYTFGMNYYWMMGDNRHNSWDSRYWGFVPEDHVVGKPVFIFWSMDSFVSGLDKIRTERLFTVVHGEGKPRSYLLPFAILVALYYGWEWYRKRKKA
jgi:signal peptidase I